MNAVKLRDLGLAFAAAIAGFLLFQNFGVPAASLTGATAAVSLVAMLGLDVSFPVPLRNAVILVLGVNIGSAVSPEALGAALSWPASLVVMTLCIFVAMFLNAQMLGRIWGYDRQTALLAASPGHLTFVLSIAVDNNRNVPAISIMQSVRVLILTLCVPPLITLVFGATGETVLPEKVLPALHIVLTLAAAVPVSLILGKTGLPAPWLLGGMIVSAVGHGSGISPGRLPDMAGIAAFILMGTLIGSRFSATRPRQVLAYLLPGVAVTLVTIAVALGGVLATSWFLGLPAGLLTIAYSPGAIEAMAAISIALGYEPTFIAAHHVFRLLVLSILMPVLFRKPGT